MLIPYQYVLRTGEVRSFLPLRFEGRHGDWKENYVLAEGTREYPEHHDAALPLETFTTEQQAGEQQVKIQISNDIIFENTNITNKKNDIYISWVDAWSISSSFRRMQCVDDKARLEGRVVKLLSRDEFSIMFADGWSKILRSSWGWHAERHHNCEYQCQWHGDCDAVRTQCFHGRGNCDVTYFLLNLG